MDLAGGHLERDVGEGAHGAVALGDLRQDDPRLPTGYRLLRSDGKLEFVHAGIGVVGCLRMTVGSPRRALIAAEGDRPVG